MGNLTETYHKVIREYPQFPEMRRDLNDLYNLVVRDLNHFQEQSERVGEILDETLPGIDGNDRKFLLGIFQRRLEYSSPQGSWKGLETFLHYLEFK